MTSQFDPSARASGLTLLNDLAQAGATFNDVTRLPDGGLWSTPTDSNGQHPLLPSATSSPARGGGAAAVSVELLRFLQIAGCGSRLCEGHQ